jgi:hypothetical protein
MIFWGSLVLLLNPVFVGFEQKMDLVERDVFSRHECEPFLLIFEWDR